MRGSSLLAKTVSTTRDRETLEQHTQAQCRHNRYVEAKQKDSILLAVAPAIPHQMLNER